MAVGRAGRSPSPRPPPPPPPPPGRPDAFSPPPASPPRPPPPPRPARPAGRQPDGQDPAVQEVQRLHQLPQLGRPLVELAPGVRHVLRGGGRLAGGHRQ